MVPTINTNNEELIISTNTKLWRNTTSFCISDKHFEINTVSYHILDLDYIVGEKKKKRIVLNTEKVDPKRLHITKHTHTYTQMSIKLVKSE